MLLKEFAEKAGVTPGTVRHYARVGLLNPPRDPRNGYQRFGREDLVRIQFIRTAQAAGFTLSVAGDLLRDEMRGAVECCIQMRSSLQCMIADARVAIDTLQSRLQRMESLLADWGEAQGCDETRHCICPQIERVTDLPGE